MPANMNLELGFSLMLFKPGLEIIEQMSRLLRRLGLWTEEVVAYGVIAENWPPEATTRAGAQHSDMCWIPGGTFRMGSDQHYPEEAPVHRVTVDGFWIDRTPVTNREFRKFVERDRLRHLRRDRARRRRTIRARCRTCSRPARWSSRRPSSPVDLRDWSQVVEFKFGANWRQPVRPRQLDQRARRPSGRARRLSQTPRPTRSGPARSCRPRPSGSSPRAAVLTAPSSPGATSSRPAAGIWPTPGRASFRTRISRSTATSAPRRSTRSRRTATASTT